MAITINRVLSDGGTLASFELVTDAGSEADTLVDVSALEDANGDGTERVRVKKVVALVCDTDGGGGCVTLSWTGGPDFLTLPVGLTELNVVCTSQGLAGASGDIEFDVTANTTCSIRLYVEKERGYTFTSLPKRPL